MMDQIGIDIVKLDHFKRMEKEQPSAISRIFTKRELEQAKMRKKGEIAYYAAHFAAKEAVYKALGIALCMEGDLQELEILNDDNGRPYVILYGNIKKSAQNLHIQKIDISISFEDEYAVSAALVIRS